MTSPGTPSNPPAIPDGAYVGDASAPNAVQQLSHMTEESAKASMRGTVAPSFARHRDGVWQEGGLLGHIANFLFGPGADTPAARLADGMTELNGRLDLMEDVSGYGGLIMSTTHRFEGGNTYKVMPFNAPYGPSTTSVQLDITNHRIYLARGTWSVSTLISTSGGSGLGAPPWFRATVTAYRPDGTEYLNQWLDWQPPTNSAYFAQVPLIVPDDSGYYVCIRFTHSGQWWRVFGGTDRTKFWVNRWDMRTDENNMVINPPDGPDVT